MLSSTAGAIKEAFTTEEQGNRGPANVVDGLYNLADSLRYCVDTLAEIELLNRDAQFEGQKEASELIASALNNIAEACASSRSGKFNN